MILAFELVKLLANGKFHSGQNLSIHLKVTRVSIWKAIQYLKSLGLEIYSVRGRGYRLASPIELLSHDLIQSHLNTQVKTTIKRLDVLLITHSTNDYLKEYKIRGLPEGTACTAETQTAGRGRNGRVWFSPFGSSIAVSLFWRFKNLTPFANHLSGLSLVVGVSVVKALEKMNISAKIKWPNDIIYKDKKFVGILVETDYRADNHYQDVFIGIGLNVNNRVANITDDLKGTITDLFEILGRVPSRNKVIGEILNYLVPSLETFEDTGFSSFISVWNTYDALKDKEVMIFRPHSEIKGIAKGVNERGELLLEEKGVLKAICMGDIKVRMSIKA